MPVGAARDLRMVMREGWDGDAAKGRIFAWAGFDGESPDPGKARKGFLWYEEDKADQRGGYHLPFADVVDGELVAVSAGCRAAASRLPQTDGMSDADQAKARGVLDHYMEMMRPASEMLHVQVSEFRGNYPEISLPADIDKEALKADFFVTLPALKVGAKSRTPGRPPYGRKAAEALVREINTKRPEGRWGHLRDDERATRYDPPAIWWLAAQMVNDVVWVKGVPMTPETKEHFRVAKIINAKTALSLYGWVGEQNGELADIELETLDIAHPPRAGLEDAVAVPHLTREQTEEQPSPPTPLPQGEGSKEGETGQGEGETAARQPVSEQTREGARMENLDELIAEMRTERDKAVKELETHRKLAAELGAIIPGSDLVAGAQKLAAENADLKKKVLASEIQSVIETEVKLAALRPIIAEMLGPVASKEAAQTRVRELQETSYIQRIGKALALEIGGPRVTVNGQGVLTEKFEDTDEKRQEARNAFGL